MSKNRNFSLAAKAGIVLAFTTLTSAVAYRAGLSSAGTGGSTEPISDIIQAFAALAGVLVAGYGIFVTDDSAGKERKISALKEKVDKWEKIAKDFKLYEREIAIHFVGKETTSGHGRPAPIKNTIGRSRTVETVKKKIRKAMEIKFRTDLEWDEEKVKKFLSNREISNSLEEIKT